MNIQPSIPMTTIKDLLPKNINPDNYNWVVKQTETSLRLYSGELYIDPVDGSLKLNGNYVTVNNVSLPNYLAFLTPYRFNDKGTIIDSNTGDGNSGGSNSGVGISKEELEKINSGQIKEIGSEFVDGNNKLVFTMEDGRKLEAPINTAGIGKDEIEQLESRGDSSYYSSVEFFPKDNTFRLLRNNGSYQNVGIGDFTSSVVTNTTNDKILKDTIKMLGEANGLTKTNLHIMYGYNILDDSRKEATDTEVGYYGLYCNDTHKYKVNSKKGLRFVFWNDTGKVGEDINVKAGDNELLEAPETATSFDVIGAVDDEPVVIGGWSISETKKNHKYIGRIINDSDAKIEDPTKYNWELI